MYATLIQRRTLYEVDLWKDHLHTRFCAFFLHYNGVGVSRPTRTGDYLPSGHRYAEWLNDIASPFTRTLTLPRRCRYQCPVRHLGRLLALISEVAVIARNPRRRRSKEGGSGFVFNSDAPGTNGLRQRGYVFN